MLTTYPPADHPAAALTAGNVAWIDLLRPTDDERKAVEARYSLQLPSLDELTEVELSSRVSEENGVLFLNMPSAEVPHDAAHGPLPIGFVLGKDFLVTIRYGPSRPFDAVAKKLAKLDHRATGTGTFAALVDEIVDASADALEGVAAELAAISRSVFSTPPGRSRGKLASNDDLRRVLAGVGNAGERLSRIRDSVLGLQRIVSYVATSEVSWISHELRARLASPRSDLASLNEYETNLADKAQFVLDAVLGFINIKQSDIFQVLTVISVVGIPPTLVASMYGMNFKNMPELSWTWGYQYGLAMILISAMVPILWFKWKKWI
jgi:magnesium transporter